MKTSSYDGVFLWDFIMFKLAVFGNPISHSRSPELHKNFAQQAGMVIDYQKILVPIDGFYKAANAFIKSGGSGFNITAPFKGAAFLWATTHSARATLTQAVNTIVINADGSCYGDNTDGAGFIQDLVGNKRFSVTGKRIVIHGAGGAVRGIIPALLAANPAKIWLINRTHAKALALVNEFSHLGLIQAVAYGTALAAIDLVIDGSSTACQDFNGLAALQFNDDALAYDLKYATEPTAFMAWAKARGIFYTTDGFGLLIEQAAFSFELWTGFYPDTQGLIHR